MPSKGDLRKMLAGAVVTIGSLAGLVMLHARISGLGALYAKFAGQVAGASDGSVTLTSQQLSYAKEQMALYNGLQEHLMIFYILLSITAVLGLSVIVWVMNSDSGSAGSLQ